MHGSQAILFKRQQDGFFSCENDSTFIFSHDFSLGKWLLEEDDAGVLISQQFNNVPT
jgi:hypothetical protein